MRPARWSLTHSCRQKALKTRSTKRSRTRMQTPPCIDIPSVRVSAANQNVGEQIEDRQPVSRRQEVRAESDVIGRT